jgi:hypothetical protein
MLLSKNPIGIFVRKECGFTLVTDKKSNGPEIYSEERTKERNIDDAIIPLKYGKTPTDPLQITTKCNDVDGKENKEECPVFTNRTPNEILIQTIETIIVFGNCYDWKEEEKEKLYPFEEKPPKAREPLLWTNRPTNQPADQPTNQPQRN